MRKPSRSPSGATGRATHRRRRGPAAAATRSGRRSSSATPAGSPSTSISTPALSLRTEPASPSATACRYTNGRKPTPCTVPVTRQQRAGHRGLSRSGAAGRRRACRRCGCRRTSVRSTTMPGGLGGDLADARRVGAERVGAQGARARRRPRSGATTATTLPSLATYSGSMPSRSHAPFTAGSDRQRRPRRGRRPGRCRGPARCRRCRRRRGSGRAASGSTAPRSSSASTSSPSGRGVGADVGLEREVAAGQHHRHAVVGDGARDEHDVARLARGSAPSVPSGGDDADAGGGDVHAVGRAAADHLGVAGDDRHAGGPRPRRPCRRRSPRSSAIGKPSSSTNAADSQRGLGALHREVVDGAVHGEVADGAAREAQRLARRTSRC